MPVIRYSSSDAGAPVLDGLTPMSDVLLKKACLVDGFGAKSPAGWIYHSDDAGNEAALFQQGPGSESQRFLSVRDQWRAATYSAATMVGYETASAWDTGVNQFATTGGAYVMKSVDNSATARAWELIADDSMFYLFVDQSGNGEYHLSGFGDIVSDKLNDPYKQLLFGWGAFNNATAEANDRGSTLISIISSTIVSHALARSFDGTEVGKAAGKFSDVVRGSNLAMGAGNIIHPDPATGKTLMHPIFINETNTPRGHLPGLWAPLHSRPRGNLEVFPGEGVFAGKTFLAINTMRSGGQAFVEISDTWDK